jgi:hypothetical protein
MTYLMWGLTENCANRRDRATRHLSEQVTLSRRPSISAPHSEQRRVTVDRLVTEARAESYELRIGHTMSRVRQPEPDSGDPHGRQGEWLIRHRWRVRGNAAWRVVSDPCSKCNLPCQESVRGGYISGGSAS